MNCLNREEIQFYIDQELSAKENDCIEKHIESCTVCKEQVCMHKLAIQECFAHISDSDYPVNTIEIPNFSISENKQVRTKFKHFRQIAASIIIIISIAGGYKIYESNTQVNYNSMELEWELNHSQSLNKQWQDREIVISITDKNGKLVHLSEI